MTKAGEIEAYLREEILSGRWKEGQILPGEMAFLSMLGVSRATLRQALGVLAAEGLIVRKKSSGTFVAPGVRKRNTVALTAIDRHLSSLNGYWLQTLVDLVREQAEHEGYRLMLAVGRGGRSEDFVQTLTIPDRQSRAGLAGVIDTALNVPLIRQLAEEGVPTVSISMGIPRNEHCIVLDYQKMMMLAVEVFRGFGIDDFAVMDVEPPAPASPGWEEVRHTRDYSTFKHAIQWDEDHAIYVRRSLNYDHAYDAFIEWWERPNRPNAIFFIDDVLCDVALRAISDLRIDVPTELSILTHSNKGRRFHSPIPLSRIEFDPAEVVEAAWKMLKKLVSRENIDQPVEYILPRVEQGDSILNSPTI